MLSESKVSALVAMSADARAIEMGGLTENERKQVYAKLFWHERSFVPSGWSKFLNRKYPMEKTEIAEPVTIAEVLPKIPKEKLDSLVHENFTKVTIREVLESLKDKKFFTLKDLAKACQFEDEEKSAQVEFGTQTFKAIVGAMIKSGRVINAKKGPSGDIADPEEKRKAINEMADLGL
jgi:hypothetical protein